MSTSGCILKNKDEYIVDNMISNTKNAIFNAKLHMRNGEIAYKEVDGKFDYLNLGVFDDTAFNLDPEDWGNEEIEQGQSLNLYIKSIDTECEHYYEEFDWVSNKSKLYKVAFIENVIDNEEIVFNFIYEYLKLNPQDYFWVEDDWVYTLEDMELLNKLPFDENWCYKNPSIK